MQIQINTGHSVDANTALTAHVEAAVRKALIHLEAHLTRVEVHLDDKTGIDEKSCSMEARPRHHQPMVVSHKADNLHQAVDGAARKLKSSLEHLFGRLENQHHRPEFDDESPL